MSAPNASSSSSQLVSYAQDVDYTRTEGFKLFKRRYNIKNAQAARNDPNTAYPSAETVYQAVKGPGCTLHSLDALSLDDFISAGSVAACCRLKHLSLAPCYAAQMKHCTQKWDRRDNQGPNSEMIDICWQLVGITGGKGSITWWVHAESMEGSETICPAFTQWVRGGYFSKVPTKVPTG